MPQNTDGVRALLSAPAIYNAFQNVMGGRRRGEIVDTYIRPHSGARILDLGCGTSQILEFLPPKLTYVGQDICDAYIEYARKRYGGRGKFLVGKLDSSSDAFDKSFDIVIAWGVLHHLSDDQAEELIILAKNALLPGGRFVSIDPTYYTGQNRLSRLLVSLDRGQNVRSGNEYNKLGSRHFSNVKGSIRNQKWIPYTHWIMECVA